MLLSYLGNHQEDSAGEDLAVNDSASISLFYIDAPHDGYFRMA